MKTKLQYSLIGLMKTITSIIVNAQDVITFNVNSKMQRLNSLETWSGVNMHHVKMSPTPSDLIIDINSHNYTMGLKF